MFVGYFASLFQGKADEEESENEQNLDEFGDPIEDANLTDEERKIVETFNNAANLLPKVVSNIDEKTILRIYALYKQSTSGPATYFNRPSMLYLRNRRKYDVWSSLGRMNKFVAMKEYIDQVSKYCNIEEKSKSSQGFGLRPSTLVRQNSEGDDNSPLNEWFTAAKNGEIVKLEEQLSLLPELLEQKDLENGMTALLWAADSGNDETVQFLLCKGADIKSVDFEGNSALDLATICEHESVIGIIQKDLEKKEILFSN